MSSDNNNLPSKILVIDGDRTVAESLKPQLSKYNIVVHVAADFESALYLFNQQRFEVCLIEQDFEPITGLSVAQKFRAHENLDRANIGIIIATGQNRKSHDVALLKELGNLEMIDKPVQAIKLLPFLMRALARKNAATQLDEVQKLSYHVLKKTGDVGAAIEKVKTSISGLETSKLNMICDLFEKAEAYDEGIAYLDPMLANDAKNTTLLNMKAKMLLKKGDAAGAQQLFEQANEAAPNNIDRLEALAAVYLKMKNPDASADTMKQLIELHPELRDKRFDFFKDLEDAGFQEHAIKLCKDTNTSPKDVIRFYNNKGVSLNKMGDWEGALKEYFTALLYYPKYKDNYRIYFNIALAECAKRDRAGFVAAEEALTKCLKFRPDFEKGKKLHKTILEKLAGSKKSA